jgi:receptor protein-tyrosine kinase
MPIDQYPPESRVASERTVLSERGDVRPDHPRVRVASSEVRPITKPTNLQSNNKLIVGPDRNAVSLEQYRRLAATLHEAQVDRGIRTVMVTSAVPAEGKTLTVVNLALTLSESYGRRVLLIDGDLRRPSIHELLGIPNDRGLGEVLREGPARNPMELPLFHVSSLLTVLPSGRLGENPLAGLSSDRMRLLLQDAEKHFDWVLLDTPPVGLLSDAQLLARLAQAVVFVIRAGATPFHIVDKAISDLGRDCIIGTVLNGVEEGAISSTTYYGGYYRHD